MNVNRPATIKIDKRTMSNSYCEKLFGATMSNSYCEKLFGAKTDSQFDFNNHLETITRKTVRRYMFWLVLHLICVFQKESSLCFSSKLNLAAIHLYGCVIVA